MKIELLNGEVFKGLTNHIGISNYGRVLNRDRKVFINPRSTAQGYLFFDYKQGGERFRVNLARTVLRLHNPVENEKEYYVKWLDGDKTNVNLSNLSWAMDKGLCRNIPKYIIKDGETFKKLGNYQVSNFGTVTFEGRNIKPAVINKKYYLRHTTKNSSINKALDFLVASLFVENPNNYNIVEHLDKNLYNCNADNLKWSRYRDSSKEDKILTLQPGEIYLPSIIGELYHVSNFGNVKNIKTNKIIKQRLNKKGYPRISYKLGGKTKVIPIHQLVLKTFNPNTDPTKNYTNHIDHNPTNNHLDNLEWVTPRENAYHARENRPGATDYVGITKNKNGTYKMRVYIGSCDTKEEATEKLKECYKLLGMTPKFLKRDKKPII